ncbi:MAG: hypothetical protein HOI95_00725, partial [Chromatiales bacterium]|nr:hypothetical protein [Chromatiales bacterium]
MKLRLRLPRQEATVPKGLEIRPVYLEEWIEGLPYAQTLNVIEQLYERLRQLNRAPLKPSLRADLLEKFLPAMAFLREAQVRQASTHSLATFDRARVDTDGARQVANQLAFGYKLVLAQSLSRHTFLGGGKYVRLGAQRACQWLSLVLVHAYHEYLPTVPHVWAELGELYRYTRSEDLDRRPSQGLQPGDPFSDSVERAFKRITLLSLVDPLRLGHGDVWAVHDWLREPADQMELVAVSGELPSESSWIIDTAADRGPVMAEAFVPTADAS